MWPAEEKEPQPKIWPSTLRLWCHDAHAGPIHSWITAHTGPSQMGFLTHTEAVQSLPWFYVDSWRMDSTWSGMKLGYWFGTRPAATKLFHLKLSREISTNRRKTTVFEKQYWAWWSQIYFSGQTSIGFRAQRTYYPFTAWTWEISINVVNKEALEAEWGIWHRARVYLVHWRYLRLSHICTLLEKKPTLISLWLVVYLSGSTDC